MNNAASPGCEFSHKACELVDLGSSGQMPWYRDAIRPLNQAARVILKFYIDLPHRGQAAGSRISMKQVWNPASYATHARFVSDLGAAVLDLLAPQPGERILDLGCGDGELTEKLARRGCDVVGIDSSPAQVKAAQSRGLDVRLISGESLAFEHEFDAVFSNAVLHWLSRADRVVAGVWHSLNPGGRFVAEFGGSGNVTRIVQALNNALSRRGIDGDAWNPWFFPSVTEYLGILEAQGFNVASMCLTPRPTPLPGDILEWLGIFAQSFLAAVPESDRDTLLREVRDELRPAIFCRDRGVWVVDYVRLRFHATKPIHA